MKHIGWHLRVRI